MMQIERLELHLPLCDQRCLFCSESGRFKAYARYQISYASIIRTLARKRRDGCVHITFTGGEWTVWPRFPEVLRAAKRIGYRTYLVTNGSRLSRPEYAREIIPYLDDVCLSIHSDTPQVHDILARSPGSFSRVMAALWQIARFSPRPNLFTNTIVSRLNLSRIIGTVEMLAGLGFVRHCTISNLVPDGAALENFLDVIPRLTEIADLAGPLNEISRRTGVEIRFSAMPVCLLGERWDMPNDLYWSPSVTVERDMVGGRVGLREIQNPNPGRMRFYAPKCANCGLREKFCFGIFKTYYERYGDAELRPRVPTVKAES